MKLSFNKFEQNIIQESKEPTMNYNSVSTETMISTDKLLVIQAITSTMISYQSSFTILNFSKTVLPSLYFWDTSYALSYFHPNTSPQSEQETSATLCNPVIKCRSSTTPVTRFITWENKKALPCFPYNQTIKSSSYLLRLLNAKFFVREVTYTRRFLICAVCLSKIPLLKVTFHNINT